MPISDARWKQFADSRFPWERDALDFLRAGLPDHEPFRVWALMEFIADDGSISEVDALVHAPGGLFLVEIKSHPGHLGGDAYTWEWKHDGRIRSFENPRILANRKAKRLKSLLARQPGWKKLRRRFPYLRAIVFCSATNLHCSLTGAAATDVLVRDGSAAEKGGIPGILAYLRAAPANLHERLDKRSAKAVGKALEEAGLRATRSNRRLGDYELSQQLDEGAGFQDYLATRPDLPRLRRRVRLYTSATGTTEEGRRQLERAARREFQILEGLEHPGLVKAVDFKTHPLGPALVFEYDPSALRLDHYLRQHGSRLGIADRLDLLRQIAETLAYGHGHQLFHRGLSPRSVMVSGVDSALQVRLLDWQTGARAAGSSTAGGSVGNLLAGTAHVEDLVEGAMAAYLAPEADRPEASPRQLDVFSLGALAYLLLTNSPPATSRVALIRKLRDGQGLQVAELLDGATSDLQELVRWSTHPDVTERLENVQDFLELLDGVEEELTRPEPEEVANPLEARKGDVLAGGLKVLKRLGQGSSAVALLVEHEDEELVLKLSLRPDRNERLRHEGEVLDKLRHQSIVELRQVVEIGGHLALLLERAGTETLGERLRRDGRLHLDLLQRFGEDLLQVVDWLEQKGIPHRDLKPDNIGVGPLSKKGRLHLVLFDFSLARTPAENLSAGTHPFLDPFLALREPPRWDLHAERYAAAISLYEMATGTHPRWGDGRSDPAILECEVSLEAELFDPPVREALTGFFRRALKRDPRERFDTCEEMLRSWRRAFEIAAPPQPEISRDGGDPEAVFAEATLETQLAALGGFGTRALTVLDRLQVLTVDDFLRYPLGRILHARGVGYKTRKEIATVHRALSARFDVTPAADTAATETGTETEESEVSSIDLLAARPLPRERGRKRSPAMAALLGLEPAADLPAWPSQSDVARAVGVTRARVGQLLAKLRRRWRKNPSLNRLRRDLVETVEAQGGVLTADQLADALLAARGSAREEPLRSRLAAAVTRAAIEAESDLESPRIRLYRRHGRLLVATREELARWAARLGRAADRLAGDDPLPSAARVREELEAIEPTAGALPLSPESRLRLAAGASAGAAVSSRQELYPRGLSAERALRLAMGALMGARELDAEEIRSRVAARYPEATPLPERPELDRLLEEADTGLVWSSEGTGSFVSRFHAEAFTPGSGSSLSRWATTTGGTLLPVSPEVSAARSFEERLRHSLKQGGFLAITVRPRHLVRAEAELVRRYPISRVSLEERLLGAMHAVAEEAGVEWSVILGADAAGVRPSGAESADWRNLRRLVDRALPRVERQVGASERPVLLVNCGLLKRYDQLGLLERLRDQAGTRDGLPGLWVLIPSDDQEELPVLDGKPVPVITPGQWARIPDGWLKNLHRTGAQG